MRPDDALRVDWCDYAAARHAVLNWHYSRAMPQSKLLRLGAWEQGLFIGAVIFARGANLRLAGRFGLQQVECCELVRVALRAHQAPVSRIVAVALRMARRQSTGLRCVVSYADPVQDHHGGIYQALGWHYLGRSSAQSEMIVNGKDVHKRTIVSRYGTASIPRLKAMGVHDVRRGEVRWKHVYATAFEPVTRARLVALDKPYPKRVKQATAECPSAGGGAAPTHTLHITAQA